jgi:hypothetical protein
MTMNTMQAQLELGFSGQNTMVRMEALGRRTSRARWWFQQMHRVVERAMDWSSMPTPPAEQTYLRLVRSHQG